MDDHEPSAGRGTIAYRGRGDAIYLNLTNRCSCACEFCIREFSDGVYGEVLVLDQEPGVEDVTAEVERAFMDGPADEVVFCGFGEPTMRLDVVLGVTEWLRLRRIRSRLDTNGHGQLLNPDVDVPAVLATAGLTAATVSLNAADPETYDLLCRPMFSKAHRAVIRFAELCVGHGIETTLTAVDYPGADPEGCAAIAGAIGAGFRLRRLARPPETRTSEGGEV
ncbi:MAG: radical SAM protein [Thermoleophilia bacterium]|nr:radical SAM protein [Thermoleophilia bacterium]